MDAQSLGHGAADVGRRARGWCIGVLAVVETKGRAMIGPLLGWLITPLGRWAAILAFAAVTWASVAVHYEHKGASRVVAKIEQRNSVNATKAQNARRSADALPVNGLRDGYFRD